MRRLLKNMKLVRLSGIEQSDILIEDGLCARIAPSGILDFPDVESTDLANRTVMPGFIDSHIHGIGGMEFDGNAQNLVPMARMLAQSGVTAFVATTVPAAGLDYVRLLEAHQGMRMPVGCARFLGVHLEGPFISPARKGAIREEGILPIEGYALNALLEAGSGILKIITIAPEIPGALGAIEHFAKNGVASSLGHSTASYSEALEAIRRGATRVTHTFNAMPSLHHRESGLLAAALLESALYAELIGDLYHVSKEAARLLFRCKGSKRVVCVSDALMQTLREDSGLEQGQYVRYGCVFDAKGTLHGSVNPLSKQLKNLLSIGVCEPDAVAALSANCAENLGLKLGDLCEGWPADLNVLSPGGEVLRTMIGGEWV